MDSDVSNLEGLDEDEAGILDETYSPDRSTQTDYAALIDMKKQCPSMG